MRAPAGALAVILALAALLGATVAARAHAALVSSQPEDGAVVAAPPGEFTLAFNESVTPLVLRLIGPGGSAVTLANPPGRHARLAVAAPPGLAAGTHVLSWRVVSLDGHPVSGSVVFSVGAPSAAPVSDDAPAPAVAALLWAAKVALYLGLFAGIGGAFFGTWVARGTDAARGAVVAALVAGLIAVPISVGAQGLDALGLAPDRLGNKFAWIAGLETSYGLTALAAAFALFAALFSVAASSRVARALSLAGLLGAGVALALSGHASAAAPQWLMRPAVFVHAASLAFWIGALAPLAVLLRRDDAHALPALARFSRAIPFALAPLVLSGVALALVQIGTPAALVATGYGALLLAKLGIVAIVLAIAARNRFRLTPQAAAVTDARRSLVRAIVAELALVLVVFGLVAAWRFTPPPRAIEIAANRPATLHIHTLAAMADVTLKPGRRGPAQVSVLLLNGEFGGLDAREVTLTFSNAAAGIEPIVRAAARDAAGTWTVERLPLPVGGRWTVAIDILVSDFDKVQLEGTIDVRP